MRRRRFRHSPSRYTDTREPLAAFTDDVLVCCPRCAACAHVFPQPNRSRIICAACGFSKDGALTIDERSGLRLWLQTPCCGHTLWAFNRRHLNTIERYVRATLRQRVRDPNWGWSNASMTNRLPEWIITAKHRAPVLKAIATLRRK